MRGTVSRLVLLVVAVVLLSSCAGREPALKTRDLLMLDPDALVGELPAGRFEDAQFRPKLSLELPPRIAENIDLPAWLQFIQEDWLDWEYSSWIDIVRLAGVTSDPVTSRETRERHRRAVPDDVLAWLRTVEGLTVRDGTPLHVGAGVLERIEVNADRLPRHRLGECDAPCASLFISGPSPAEPKGELVPLYAGLWASIGVMQVGRERILLMVVAPEETFDAYLAKADQILTTLEFG